MSRAIILILCLATAGAIAGYTHYAGRPSAEQAAVFVVPQKTTVPAKPAAPPAATDIPTDKASVTRALQRELKRVGCYSGDVSGVWTTSSRMAMKAFVDRANAALPIDNPDPVLLSLVRNHQGQACPSECTAGQVGGSCQTAVTLAKASDDRPVPDAKADGAVERGAAIALPAAAAAGLAAAAIPKAADSARPAEPRVRTSAAPDQAAPEKAPAPATNSKPLSKVQERRSRRQKAAQPPKIIRDFLRTVERSFRPR